MTDPKPTAEVSYALRDPVGFVEWLQKQPLRDACAALDAVVSHQGRESAKAAERAAVEAEQVRLGCAGALVDGSGNHVPGCPCRSCGYWVKHTRIMERAAKDKWFRAGVEAAAKKVSGVSVQHSAIMGLPHQIGKEIATIIRAIEPPEEPT